MTLLRSRQPSAAWPDIEPAALARPPGTRGCRSRVAAAPPGSVAFAGTTLDRTSSGCEPLKPPADTSTGTSRTASAVGPRPSSGECRRPLVSTTLRPGSDLPAPLNWRSGSTSAADRRRRDPPTGSETRRSVDPTYAAADVLREGGHSKKRMGCSLLSSRGTPRLHGTRRANSSGLRAALHLALRRSERGPRHITPAS